MRIGTTPYCAVFAVPNFGLENKRKINSKVNFGSGGVIGEFVASKPLSTTTVNLWDALRRGVLEIFHRLFAPENPKS
jgi:hypothetical protein